MEDPYKKTYILKRIEKEGSFADNYPERALDWDYDDERNMPYKPSDFLSGSNKLVYWKCHVCGYKSDTPRTIISHAKAMFPCEKCAIQGRTNQRYGEDPITKTNPELLEEWDYDENEKDGIFPENITNHDTKTQVHWACKRGHHWRKSVSYRLHTAFDCPHCKKELQTSFPEQAIFFYLSKVTEAINGYKIPNNSHIDVFLPRFKVGIEYDGPYHKTEKSKRTEIWKDNYALENDIRLYRIIESTYFSRDRNKIFVIEDKKYSQVQYAIQILCEDLGLPQPTVNIENDGIQISEQYLTIEKQKSIAVQHPNLLDEWDYNLNGRIDPEFISSGSNIKLWWKCKEGHVWPSRASVRSKGHGCPYCAGIRLLPGYNDLATRRPDLLEEWDYDSNTDIRPNEISIGNNKKKVNWICKVNADHKWSATVASRDSGTGCIFCAEDKRKETKAKTYIKRNGSFAENNPALLEEWLYTENDKLGIFPDRIPTHYKGHKVLWKCKICKHIWPATPDNRACGRGCPECFKNNINEIQKKTAVKKYGSLEQNNPELLVFWDYSNNDVVPSEVTSHSQDKINWHCPNCNHKWPKRIAKMFDYPLCPQCGFRLNEEKRPILQYSLNLQFIAKYDSPQKAEDATGIRREYILSNARHDILSTNGYVWRFEDDTTDMNLYKPTHQPTPKAVLQYSLDGKLLNEWKSISEAEKAYPKAKGKISAVCKGSRNKAGGYVWKYKESK